MYKVIQWVYVITVFVTIAAIWFYSKSPSIIVLQFGLCLAVWLELFLTVHATASFCHPQIGWSSPTCHCLCYLHFFSPKLKKKLHSCEYRQPVSAVVFPMRDLRYLYHFLQCSPYRFTLIIMIWLRHVSPVKWKKNNNFFTVVGVIFI